MAVVGIDEAGKGPVIGSMFAAAIRWPNDRAFPDDLADSKQLTPELRDAHASTLRATDGVKVAVAEVPVERIDDPDTDMNSLTVAGHAEALSRVAHSRDVVRCDAADVDAGRFGERLAAAVSGDGPDGLDIRAEHQADEHHAIVSAASVLAKVARDAHVAELAERYGEIGSGYPADPTTRSFLADYVAANGCLPDCARATWKTSQRVLAAAEQSVLSEF